MRIYNYLAIITVLCFLISCGEKNSETEALIPEPGIHISEVWARPGAEQGNSAAYLLITNGYPQTDSVHSIDSDITGIVEIHESYERGEGMMGMRQIEELQLPAQSTVRLEPGGKHIMLMNLNKTLQEGDQFEITLNLASGEQVKVTVPVRLQMDKE